MAEKFYNIRQFYGGISDSRRQGAKGAYQDSSNINYRDEGTEFKLTPAATLVSGSIVTDLVKWIVDGLDGNLYFYGDTGNIYKQDSSGAWSLIHTVPTSHGQGMDVYSDYLYYSWDSGVGRFGPLSGLPSTQTFTDQWALGYQDTSKIGFAPIRAFSTGLAIGNGRYVSWYDGTIVPTSAAGSPELAALHLIPLKPTGENVRSFEVIDEYLAIGTQRGTSITSNEYGSVYYWDGASVSWNFFVSTDNGAANALANSNNRLFSILGSSSKLFINYRPFQAIQKMPHLQQKNSCEVYPGATTTWQNLVHFGVPGSTDSLDLLPGVYSWGSTGSMFSESLSYDYTISTGTVNPQKVRLGSVKGLGNYLYIGWQDGVTYGVDKVSSNGNLNTSGYFVSLAFGDIGQDQQLLTLKATHYPLNAGESVQVGYRINGTGSFNFPIAANTTVGSVETRTIVPPETASCFEVEIKVIITGPGTSTPTVYFTGLKYDDLATQTNDW